VRTTTIVCATALVGGLLTLSAALPVQDAPAREDGQAGVPVSAEEAAMYELFMKAAAPGEHHAQLATWEGTWDLVVKHWMDPNMPPGESDATSVFKTVMGGRYVIEDVEGTTPMGPFQGMGMTGFDNVTQQYVNTWIDNMSTGVMVARGGPAVDGVVSMTGNMSSPMVGGLQAFRSELKLISVDERLFTMWEDRDGTEVKTMEITYKRAQG
jgi:hypothetical protein